MPLAPILSGDVSDVYGIFSVSQSHADEVVEYILRQEKHHRKETFQQELRRFFEEQKIGYDERYVWD